MPADTAKSAFAKIEKPVHDAWMLSVLARSFIESDGFRPVTANTLAAPGLTDHYHVLVLSKENWDCLHWMIYELSGFAVQMKAEYDKVYK